MANLFENIAKGAGTIFQNLTTTPAAKQRIASQQQAREADVINRAADILSNTPAEEQDNIVAAFGRIGFSEDTIAIARQVAASGQPLPRDKATELFGSPGTTRRFGPAGKFLGASQVIPKAGPSILTPEQRIEAIGEAPEGSQVEATFPTKGGGKVTFKSKQELSPTQKIAKRKLALIEEIGSIPKTQRTPNQQARFDKALLGQPLVQIGGQTPASASERTDLAESQASLDALVNLNDLFDESFVGIARGRIGSAKGLLGLTSDKQEDFLAATSAFRNLIIKQITGAQMSEAEATRILKQVPQETDPPARWKAKWRQSVKNIQRIQKRRAEVLQRSGLRVPIPNMGSVSVSAQPLGQSPTTVPQTTPSPLTDVEETRRQELLRKAGQ